MALLFGNRAEVFKNSELVKSSASDIIMSTTVLPPAEENIPQQQINFTNGQMNLEDLWRLLEHQRKNGSMVSVVGLDEAKLLEANNTGGRHAGMSTLELVIIQGVLLGLLIILSVTWAFCCKKRCIGDQALVTDFTSHLATLARKLSNSSREMPPSYSKVDLTSVGLTLNDHLNPPPTYDRLITMLESGEITSIPVHLHPEIERRMSLASNSSNSRRTSRSSAKSSINSSNDGSRKSSKVTFAPNLVHGPGSSRKGSSQSLPLVSVLVENGRRKQSATKSEGSNTSRRVSFIDELTGMSAAGGRHPAAEFTTQLNAQLEIVKEDTAATAGEMAEFTAKSSNSIITAAETG